MKFRPFAITWSESADGVVTQLRGRDERGTHREVKLLGIEPAFWVLADEPVPNDYRIVRVEDEPLPGFHGEKLKRIVVRLPSDMRDLKEHFSKTWEADVAPNRHVRYKCGMRSVIDIPDDCPVLRPHQIRSVDDAAGIMPRVCVFDIETDDRDGYGDPLDPKKPVVSLALWDSLKERYVYLYTGTIGEAKQRCLDEFSEQGWQVDVYEALSEYELLSAFAKFLKQVNPDVLAGWNSKGYDVPYLKGRMKECRVWVDWREYAHLDLMLAYEKLHKARYGELEESSLEFVATQIFNLQGKTNHGRKIHDLMDHDPDELAIYNVNDVYLTKEIMLRANIIPFYLTVAGMAGIDIEEALSEVRIVDGFMFHQLHGTCILPSTVELPFVYVQGGDVFALEGIHENVIEVDNSAEYPSIGRTFNLSPETKVRPEDYGKYSMDETYNLGTGRRYLKDEDGQHPRGQFPLAWDILIQKRDAYKAQGKKTEELAVKVIMNSFYGALKNQFCRFGDPEIAADITFGGRDHLGWNTRIAEKRGGKNTLRDTDSTHFTIPGLSYEETEAIVDSFVDEMNASYVDFVKPYGAKRHFLQVKKEHVYVRQLVAGKKFYACIYKDSKGDIKRDGETYSMKVRGFQLRRSSSAPITKVVQYEALLKVLFNESMESIERYVADTVRRLRSGEIPITDCRIPTKIGKDFKDYKVKGSFVRAAEWSNAHLGKRYSNGSKPCYYFGYIEGKPRTDVFALDWNDTMPKDAVIDYAATVERVITKPLATMLKVTPIVAQHAVQGRRQQSLD